MTTKRRAQIKASAAVQEAFEPSGANTGRGANAEEKHEPSLDSQTKGKKRGLVVDTMFKSAKRSRSSPPDRTTCGLSTNQSIDPGTRHTDTSFMTAAQNALSPASRSQDGPQKVQGRHVRIEEDFSQYRENQRRFPELRDVNRGNSYKEQEHPVMPCSGEPPALSRDRPKPHDTRVSSAPSRNVVSWFLKLLDCRQSQW